MLNNLRYESVLGYQVVTDALNNCVQAVIDRIFATSETRYFVCANPHSLAVANSDVDFQKALKNADLTIPDGAGIVLASWLLGGKIKERITGMDMFTETSKKLNERKQGRYFFLGSTESTLEQIRQKMRSQYPHIEVAGTYSPPFKPEFDKFDNERMIQTINEARPDILWVGMTAPKQEKWIYQHKCLLNVRFIGAIGAAFDFFIGRIRRSHPAFQRAGLEWLPRLLQEPKRLWRRTFVSHPIFLALVFREKFLRK